MYKLIEFRGLTIPEYNFETDIGTGGSAERMVAVVGGGQWDALGSSQAPREPTMITHKFALVADSSDELDAAWQQWRVLRGMVGTLTRRRRIVDEEWADEWCTARLVNASATRSTQNNLHLEVSLSWTMVSPDWYKPGLKTVTKTDLGNGVNDLEIEYAGDQDQRDIVIQVMADSGNNITQLIITNGTTGHTLAYNGTISAGDSIVFTCGAKSAKQASMWGILSDAYNDVAGPTDKTDWMMLTPGTNELSISLATTGGAHSILIAFYEAVA